MGLSQYTIGKSHYCKDRSREHIGPGLGWGGKAGQRRSTGMSEALES